VQAANVLANVDKPDWKRVKAEVDKALAVDPNDPRANYVAGIALANQGDSKGAIPLLQKAKANAGSDTSLSADIDTALKKLSPPKP
jgi:cytochrome c-type biogenesis protein CcmH/NrfG